MPTPFLAIFDIGPMELVAIGGVALLIFGNRLPDVGKNFGKFIVEFKKGMRDIEKDVAAQPATQPPAALDQPSRPVANLGGEYKFDPYTGKPIGEKTPAEQKQA